MKDLCLGLLVVAIATSASLARAQGREHDGFMARFTGGVGYAVAKEEIDVSLEAPISEVELSGPGVMFSVDIGGSPIENLVLHGRFGAISVASPTFKIDGEEADVDLIDGSDDRSSLTLLLLGPAVSYYVMPANVYFTLAAGLGVAGVTFGNRDGSTDPGWAINLDAGWEFWVGQSWGMGPALRFFYVSAKDDIEGTDEDPTMSGIGGGAVFSATFQ